MKLPKKIAASLSVSLAAAHTQHDISARWNIEYLESEKGIYKGRAVKKNFFQIWGFRRPEKKDPWNSGKPPGFFSGPPEITTLKITAEPQKKTVTPHIGRVFFMSLTVSSFFLRLALYRINTIYKLVARLRCAFVSLLRMFRSGFANRYIYGK